jgi:hypothetical protein
MLDFRKSSINSALRKVLKRFHYPLEVMLTCVRWYVAYPLSLRHIEEMIAKSAVFSLTTPRYTSLDDQDVAGTGSRFSKTQEACGNKLENG